MDERWIKAEKNAVLAATGALGFGAKPPGITSNLLDKYCAYADRAHMDRLFYLRHHGEEDSRTKGGKSVSDNTRVRSSLKDKKKWMRKQIYC